MSMVPLFFRDWWDDFDRERPRRLLDQHFGLGLKRDDLLKNFNELSSLRSGRYLRPWGAEPLARSSSGSSNLKVDDKQYQVILDVQQFAPEEITVKIADGYIVVEGKHSEKKDEHGLISRQFTRKYTCPKEADFDKIVSNLSLDGVLTINVPKKIQGGDGERYVPIIQTGAPAITPTTEPLHSAEEPKATNETHIKIQQEGK